MGNEMLESFGRNTRVKIDGNRISIDCKRGLWGINSPNKGTALTEALHYFQQYWADGEYDKDLPATKTERDE